MRSFFYAFIYYHVMMMKIHQKAGPNVLYPIIYHCLYCRILPNVL